jgi:hypothetical protein
VVEVHMSKAHQKPKNEDIKALVDRFIDQETGKFRQVEDVKSILEEIKVNSLIVIQGILFRVYKKTKKDIVFRVVK